MKKNTKPFLIFSAIASLILFVLFNRMAWLYMSTAGNLLEKANAAVEGLLPSISARPFFISFAGEALVSGLIGAVIMWLIYIYNAFASKKYMLGREHGSAEWGTAKDIKLFQDNETPDNNIILSQTERLSMSDRMPITKADDYNRNKNVVVIGGSGSGKTRFFIKPNIMQLHSSYVITDPKGDLIVDTGKMLKDAGYEVKCLNTIDFSKSLHFNPLAYIRDEKDILKVVTVLLENTTGDGKEGDKFWRDCEQLLYTAFIAYLWSEAPAEDCNIPTLIDMVEQCKVKENDEDYVSPIDILFEELAKKPGKENCLAVKQYRKFKLAAGETMKSILISCGARLAPFDIPQLREMMMYDELELDTLGDRKTALFVIMSDTDTTFSFVIAMMMYQMFNLLCTHADVDCGGKLPIHVRCLLDEFANCGKIPNFEHLISTIRSRRISACPVLQSQAQLKSVYKDDADTIIDCCDTLIFLGGKSTTTNKNLSETMGKATIDNRNINETKGEHGSYQLQNQSMGRDLLDPAEVGRMQRSKCIVMISGCKPFQSRKYDIESHPRYKQLKDYDPANAFDIAAKTGASEWENAPTETANKVVVYERVDCSELNELATELA